MIKSQTLIPLTGGAYQARDKISDYEICENLFPELNPQAQNPPVPVTHYPREGLRPLSSPTAVGLGRGVFTASNGALYACVGNSIYYIAVDWTWKLLGKVGTISNPISFDDDGQTAMIVDGSGNGYQITLTGNVFSAISDPTGTFQGSNRVVYSDTYFVFSTPGTNEWGITNPNSVTFNALQVANRDSRPDPIICVVVNIRVAWVLGALTSEVWWLAGSTPFPYQEFPNVFVPYGCVSSASVVQADIDLFWISRNDQGQAIAVKTKGYSVEAISTRALEYEWSTYATIADVIGGTFQQAGHTFILFHFPTADKSWAYDLATQQWHRRTYLGNDGKFHRDRTAFYASVGAQGGYPPTIVGQDWATGQIYALDPQTFTDNGVPIVCRRSFPHQVADMREITMSAFVVDFATGEAPVYDPNATSQGMSDFNSDFNADFGGTPFTISGPVLGLRYSRNGGYSWSGIRTKGLNFGGDYRSMMRYRGLGMGRDWVFEVIIVYVGKCALNGAYADVIEHSS